MDFPSSGIQAIDLTIAGNRRDAVCFGDYEYVISKDGQKVDLNEGADGSYIYMCQRKTTDTPNLLEDVKFRVDNCESGYTKIDKDANKGADGRFIYPCYKQTNENSTQYITDLKLTSQKEKGPACPAGYEADPQDLNEGSGGQYIYLCKKKENVADLFQSYCAVGNRIFNDQRCLKYRDKFRDKTRALLKEYCERGDNYTKEECMNTCTATTGKDPRYLTKDECNNLYEKKCSSVGNSSDLCSTFRRFEDFPQHKLFQEYPEKDPRCYFSVPVQKGYKKSETPSCPKQICLNKQNINIQEGTDNILENVRQTMNCSGNSITTESETPSNYTLPVIKKWWWIALVISIICIFSSCIGLLVLLR